MNAPDLTLADVSAINPKKKKITMTSGAATPILANLAAGRLSDANYRNRTSA